MNYYRNKRRNEDVFVKAMKFIQWAYINGGIPLVLICVGGFALMIAIISAFIKVNYFIFLIAISLIGLGMFLNYREGQSQK